MNFKEWLAKFLNTIVLAEMNWTGGKVAGIVPQKAYPVRRNLFIAGESNYAPEYVTLRFDSVAQKVAAELHYTDVQAVLDADCNEIVGVKDVLVEGEGTVVTE